MDYLSLPKIELHCHLDGSVRLETISRYAKIQGLSLPDNDKDLKALLIAPESCPSLDDYLKRFSLPVKIMQTKEALKDITFELFEDAAKENVKYMEVRFGPLLHLKGGLSIDQVLQSVLEGMRLAEKRYDIKGNIIISILRTMATDQVYDLIDVASNYLNKGIVAVDLASSEIEGFSQTFKSFIDYAKSKGFYITIHAGETGVGRNVLEAIEILNASRIGHGIYISNTPKAYHAVKEKNIVLEVCPTSNQQTKAVNSIENHPIGDFIKDHLKVTINTDNRTVSNTTLTNEIKKVMETFDFDIEVYKEIYRNSVLGAFIPESEKDILLSNIENI
jgi:adenosine deaminase